MLVRPVCKLRTAAVDVGVIGVTGAVRVGRLDGARGFPGWLR